MRLKVRSIVCSCTLLASVASSAAFAQTPAGAAGQGATIPVTQLITEVSRKTNKKFLVDPRVQADVSLVGLNSTSLDYAGLLAVLQVHGYAALDDGNYVQVVPAANARQMPVPLVTGKERHPDAEYVSRVITVKSMPAAQLVPVLRPLLPQQAHLVAIPCSNVLILVDTFGNMKRIEKLVEAVDTGEGYRPEKCGAPPAQEKSGA